MGPTSGRQAAEGMTVTATRLHRHLPRKMRLKIVCGRCMTSDRERKIGSCSLYESVTRFVQAEDGPTAVEYAVMLALIIVVCITAITTLGTNANNTFSNVGA